MKTRILKLFNRFALSEEITQWNHTKGKKRGTHSFKAETAQKVTLIKGRSTRIISKYTLLWPSKTQRNVLCAPIL